MLGPQNTPPVPEDEEKYTFEYLWIVIGALIAAVGIFFMVATLICIGKIKIGTYIFFHSISTLSLEIVDNSFLLPLIQHA